MKNTIKNLNDSLFSLKDLKNNVKKFSFYFTNIDIVESKKLKINQNNNIIYNFSNQSMYKKYKSIYNKYDLLNVSILSENYKLLYIILYAIKMYYPESLKILIEKIIISHNPNHYQFDKLNRFDSIHNFSIGSILNIFKLCVVIQERGFYKNKLYYERYVTLNENGKFTIYLQKNLISINKKENTEYVTYKLLNYQNKLKNQTAIVISFFDKLYEGNKTNQGNKINQSNKTNQGKGTNQSKRTNQGKGTNQSKRTNQGKGTNQSKRTNQGKGTNQDKGTSKSKK